MCFIFTRRSCDAPNCKLCSRKKTSKKKEQAMNKYEIEFRVASLRREAQTNALLKEIRTAESAALRQALGEILGIFKHWTFGLPQVQNTKIPMTM
jgi:hypothetical protein